MLGYVVIIQQFFSQYFTFSQLDAALYHVGSWKSVTSLSGTQPISAGFISFDGVG